MVATCTCNIKPTIDPAPHRPPQMCPGCGHRSAFHAVKQALAPTDITVADIGCHTLGFLPPYEMGQLLMCMGASTAMASGLRLFNTSRKVIAFMGDSTFFHAALPGIVNAIFNRHPITLILMENGTTAMTGHQDHAASGKNFNEVTDKIPVRQVLEGLGVKHIFDVDTYQQAKLIELVVEATSIDAFSVVIARHPCMLKFAREQSANPGFQQKQVTLDPGGVRANSHLYRDHSAARPSPGTAEEPCHHQHRSLHRRRFLHPNLPDQSHHPGRQEERQRRCRMKAFNVYLTGVGGQGIGLIGEIILRAADHGGHPVKSVDTHGLAQRGGIVVSQIRFGENVFSPLISCLGRRTW
jgi:pyruvate/2-oxoacid:ferredoxin oxidoreductase beta subunit